MSNRAAVSRGTEGTHEVGLGEDGGGEHGAHAPAATQRLQGPRLELLAEPERRQQLVHAPRGRLRVNVLQPLQHLQACRGCGNEKCDARL